MASRKFNVPRTIARVTRRQNKELFAKLGGVSQTVCTTDIISAIVEDEVSTKDVVTRLSFNEGKAAILEMQIKENSPAKDKCVTDLNLPEDSVLISIFRGKEVIFPRGETSLKVGDKVIAMATRENKILLRNLLVGETS